MKTGMQIQGKFFPMPPRCVEAFLNLKEATNSIILHKNRNSNKVLACHLRAYLRGSGYSIIAVPIGKYILIKKEPANANA